MDPSALTAVALSMVEKPVVIVPNSDAVPCVNSFKTDTLFPDTRPHHLLQPNSMRAIARQLQSHICAFLPLRDVLTLPLVEKSAAATLAPYFSQLRQKLLNQAGLHVSRRHTWGKQPQFCLRYIAKTPETLKNAAELEAEVFGGDCLSFSSGTLAAIEMHRTISSRKFRNGERKRLQSNRKQGNGSRRGGRAKHTTQSAKNMDRYLFLFRWFLGRCVGLRVGSCIVSRIVSHIVSHAGSRIVSRVFRFLFLGCCVGLRVGSCVFVFYACFVCVSQTRQKRPVRSTLPSDRAAISGAASRSFRRPNQCAGCKCAATLDSSVVSVAKPHSDWRMSMRCVG
jgi:hypothetical protein